LNRRILFVVPYTPSLIRVRPFQLIRHLAERGNRIFLATLWETPEEEAELKPLRDVCEQVWARPLPPGKKAWNCARAALSPHPIQSVFSWQPALYGDVVRWMMDGDRMHALDVAHIEHLRGSRYALAFRDFAAVRGLRLPIVWDSVDCISHLFSQASGQTRKQFSRWIIRFELGRTRRYERWLMQQFDRLIVTSSADRDAFLSLGSDLEGSSSIRVLPNGVDLGYFSPEEGLDREPDTVVITGKMSYHANVTMCLDFVEKIWPLVKARRPWARLWIVGRAPSREVLRLGERPEITVTGSVADIRPYLRRASIAVAPLSYGAGIQNKVLEAMACGTPVVCTERAALALRARDGEHLLVKETPEAFAEAVLEMLSDPEKRERIGKLGRDYVVRMHGWDSIARQLEVIYDEVIDAADG